MSEDGEKRIKFADELVAPVINEEKEATVRYNGYESVRVGDTLVAETETGTEFAILDVRRTASVNAVEVHSVLEVFGASYPSEKPQDVIDALNDHYEEGIQPGTTVRVIVFEEVSRHV